MRVGMRAGMLLPLLSALLLGAAPGISQAQRHTADCLALINFYNSTNKRKWMNSTGWETWNTTTTNCCLWFGVTCDAGSPRRVTAIHIASNGLSGTIPESIGNLKRLTKLALPGNMLYGSIPEALMTLSSDYACGGPNGITCNPFTVNRQSASECQGLGLCLAFAGLTHIDLQKNRLSGEIPSSVSRLWRTMTHIDLSSNRLTGTIPRSIGALRWVTSLDLYFNRLSGTLPPTIGHMISLRFLSVAFNDLSGTVPAFLGNLQRLEQIDLSVNKFSGPVPGSLGVLVDPAPPMCDRPGGTCYGSTLAAGDLSSGMQCEPMTYTLWYVSGAKHPCTSGFGSEEYWCQSCDPPFPSTANPEGCYSAAQGMLPLPLVQDSWAYDSYFSAPFSPSIPTPPAKPTVRGPNLRIRVAPRCTRDFSFYANKATWHDFVGKSLGVGKRREGEAHNQSNAEPDPADISRNSADAPANSFQDEL